MRYRVLATDYDGTLARHGTVDQDTEAALDRLQKSGRRLVLVTGRELEELLSVCPAIHRFDHVVAENGALLYTPGDRQETPLGARPPDEFVARLKERGVERISVGRVIVATWEPHQNTVLEVIRELGLELQVIFNKGAVMVLPSGINKATGLHAALDRMGLSVHNTVAVGDAENDHAFLAVSECAAAVSNALPALKERADVVLTQPQGQGVIELIDRLLDDDLASLAPRLTRHDILVGYPIDGDGTTDEPVTLPPYGRNVLVAGTSGSGKSTLTTGLLERLNDQGYQFLVVDPEGDYESLEFATSLGDAGREPTPEEVLALLEQPRQNVVLNLLGVALEHRPAYFAALLPRVQELRARTGRPHWIVVDEAHHLLPASWDASAAALPMALSNLLLITVHPGSVSPAVLDAVQSVLVIGKQPDATVAEFLRATGRPALSVNPAPLATGDVLVVTVDSGTPRLVRSQPPRTERTRHSRKYAQGHVGPNRSFRFRGPDSRLDLHAQNLAIFLQMADGVDDATWLHHLKAGDYSQWFRDVIKDPDLADAAALVEAEAARHSPAASRARLRQAVEQRYTLPADLPSGDITQKLTAP